jgi:cell division protein FtsQ
MKLPKLKLAKRNRVRQESRPLAPAWLKPPGLAWTRLVSLLLVAGAITALLLSLGLALNRPISKLTVAGTLKRVNPLDVEQAMRNQLQGGFLTARIGRLQRAVERVPWVDHAMVQRRWPDELVVRVTEQVPAARWAAGGLVNTRGELFVVDAKHLPEELPRLEGPAGSEQQVAELYFQLAPRLVESSLRVASLTLDERGAWSLELTDGITVRFGRRQIAERVERFLRTGAAVIAGRPKDISALDLRYSNGFAVAWRTQAAAAKAPPAAAKNPPKERDPDV